MLILGIESATQQVGCAIGGHEGVIALFESCKGRRHAETLVPAIDFVRRQACIDLQEISVVAVDIGPGLFTGLRVGIATAKSMASALRDRKSTRLNSSHPSISYAVFCLKKKKNEKGIEYIIVSVIVASTLPTLAGD